MKRVVLVVVVVVVAVGLVGSPSSAVGSAGCAPGFTNPDGTCSNGDPRLRFTDARERAPIVLRRRFSYEAGYSKRIGCGLRITPARIRCQVKWIVGDVSFKGFVTISNIQGQYGADDWRYRYRVKQTNEYCLAVGGSNCVDIKRGRGHG